MHKITVKDFSGLDLGDKRRDERFVKIIENIVKHPGGSILQHNEEWYDAKATYGFYKNEDITLEKLMTAIRAYGAGKVVADEVLIIHDTTTISYNDLQAEGVGYINSEADKGIFCHSSIAATTDGLPVSLLNQLIWSRDNGQLGKASRRQQRPFEQKESYKWYQGILAANELLGKEIKKIHICDREADIYALFLCEPYENAELLIRARHDRRTAAGSALWQHIGEQPVAGRQELLIPERTGKRTKKVEVEIRYKQAEILCPANLAASQYESVLLNCIEIRQTGDAKDGILWRLLTTLEVSNDQQAIQCMKWYHYRWLIERFHYVLKSGCGIEKLQLKKAGSLMKATAMYSLSALQIMQLTYQSRQTPDVSCELVLSRSQWEVLYMLKFKTQQLPSKPPTLLEATRWLAKMGGFAGRKSDGAPGLKTVWLGYELLLQATAVYEIMKFG